MSILEGAREVLGGREGSGNEKTTTKMRSRSRRLRSTRMIWTTKRKKTEERASKDEAITRRIETREWRRLGGRRWRRKFSGRGCRGNDRRVCNNGAGDIPSSGAIHRTLQTLTTCLWFYPIESEYMQHGRGW